MHYVPLIINLGNKQRTLDTFKSLCTIPNIIYSVMAPGSVKSQTSSQNVWSGESILSLLFDLGQQSSHVTPIDQQLPTPTHEQIQFRHVVEALDVCFDMAKSDPLIFPPDVND